MIPGKDPKWESELWSYVSKGDGEHCPLRENCQLRERGGPCIDDSKTHISRIGAFFGKDDPSINDFKQAQLDFMGCIKIRGVFQLAEKLAQEYLKMGKVYSPPVPTALIALCDETHAIEIREIPLQVYHGAIWYLKNKWIVYLNENDTPARQRFTLFHEAFHILAHTKTTPVFRKIGVRRGSFNELLADHFAGCILMPPAWAKEKWAECHDIDKMAEIFGIPKSIAWLGLKSVGII